MAASTRGRAGGTAGDGQHRASTDRPGAGHLRAGEVSAPCGSRARRIPMPKMRKLAKEEIDRLEKVRSAIPEGTGSSLRDQQTPSPYTHYPHLEAWVYEQGWIEIGTDQYSRSFIRILDSGGMVWE